MEEWKNIDGLDGQYQISNFGRVKSFMIKGKEKLMTLLYDRKGYCRVKLFKDSVAKAYSVHRLVANHFIPNVDNKPEVNHKNGNKKDNHFNNLEWSTRSENQYHAYSTGLKKPAKSTIGGRFNKRSKPVVQIFNDGNTKIWEGIRHASKNLKINAANICSACRGKLEQSGGFKWRYL